MRKPFVDHHRDFFDLMNDEQAIEIIFSAHDKKDADKQIYEKLHYHFKKCAVFLTENLSHQPDRMNAIFKLQEALFWAVASLERDHAYRQVLQRKRGEREYIKTTMKGSK